MFLTKGLYTITCVKIKKVALKGDATPDRA
nr:MAG TPA: hypothetical protein [Caudoviricetes sp.]